MAREIQGGTTTTSKFPPEIRLEKNGDHEQGKGSYVKGTITETRKLPVDQYGNEKPAIRLSLLDLEGGSVTISKAKGQYEEVTVQEGDIVDFVARGTDLAKKLPQLQVGETVTITNIGLGPKVKGRNQKKLFKVEVE